MELRNLFLQKFTFTDNHFLQKSYTTKFQAINYGIQVNRNA